MTYNAVQNECGFSGTETAIIELAKALIDNGHEVTISNTNTTNYVDNNIRFWSAYDTDLKTVDIYCPLFLLSHASHDYVLQNLKPTAKVWIWFHCFLLNYDSINRIRNMNFEIIVSYLSPYVAKHHEDMFEKSVVIGNGISRIFVDTPKMTSIEKKGNWIFHAVYERGGAIAKHVFDYVKGHSPDTCQIITYASYELSDRVHIPNDTHFVGSISKKQVTDLLNKSDYFVYPLVLPNTIVHHDTFGSVILEALSCGVIVITWNVACIKSVYEDNVVALDPVCINGYDPNAKFGNNSWMLSNEAIETLSQKILYLEKNPDEKENLRQKGMEWAKQHTWDVICKKYIDWFDSL